jgi:hypothetical protein
MFSGVYLLPRQYLFRSTSELIASKPRVPQVNHLSNEIRYFIFQLQDKLTRIRYDKTIRRQMKECNKRFEIQQQQYLETCAYYDELCLRHPMVNAIAEDYSSYPNDHYEDFETRFACRMAEIRILKTKYAQKLTLLRMEYLSYNCAPVLQCIYLIAPYLYPSYFSYSGYKTNQEPVVLFILQWIMYWISSHFLNFTNPREQSDQLVSNIECYIDEISMKKPDMYLMMGGPEFTNRLTRNYLSAIDSLQNRREAYQFLLVANRLKQCDNLSPFLHVKLSAETMFFQCPDLVRLVVQCLMGYSTIYCPVHIMFTFP